MELAEQVFAAELVVLVVDIVEYPAAVSSTDGGHERVQRIIRALCDVIEMQRKALERIYSERSVSIFIADENHVKDFFRPVKRALAKTDKALAELAQEK